MTKSLENKKIKILKQIASIASEQDIDAIESYLQKIQLDQKLEGIIKPTRTSITIDELKIEQSYKGIDRNEFDKLVTELNIQEPLEDLLIMID